ncbi:MAG: hypothetical protein WAM07_06770 [Halobacillus sp.]|uniref:hypothetical protein n=1 Tax=Halobacillus sp. TaxID=56800 RepID=UPI003BAFA60F
MRSDIQPNEQAFSSKEVAEEVGIATPTVRKYAQILERNGYEFFKNRDRRIFVHSDIEALISIRDTEKPLDVIAQELVEQQTERLKGYKEAGISVPDTYNPSLQNNDQLKEFFRALSSELAATREMNVQLTNDISELKTTMSRLQQDHHHISAGISNSAQKTNAKIEKLSTQQEELYETLLQQEKEKTEALQEEIKNMRAEQNKEWRLQNDFNTRLEGAMKKTEQPKGSWEWFLSLFRKF